MDNSTIHGLRELVIAPTRTSKICWAVIMLSAAGMFGYHVKDMIREYTQNPYSTQTNLFGTNVVPKVSICPYGWASMPSLEAYNVDAEMLLLLTSLFPYDIYHVRDLLNETDVQSAAARLENVTLAESNMSSVADLTRALMYEPEEIILSASENYTLRNQFDSFGVCSMIEFTDTHTENELSMVNFRIDLRQTDFPYGAAKGYDSLHVGDFGFPSDKLMLAPNVGYAVYVKTTKYAFEPVANYPCNSWTMQQRMACVENCTIGVWGTWYKCNRISFGDGAPTDNFCNISHLISKNADKKAYDICFNQCDPMCQKTVYSLTINPLEKTNGSEKFIIFSMVNVHNSMSMLQVSSYSFVRLTSNFGGILSLWFGASFLSIIQFVYLLEPCRRCKEVDRGKPTDKGPDIITIS